MFLWVIDTFKAIIIETEKVTAIVKAIVITVYLVAFSFMIKIIAMYVYCENKGNSNSKSNIIQIIDNQNFCNESHSKKT